MLSAEYGTEPPSIARPPPFSPPWFPTIALLITFVELVQPSRWIPPPISEAVLPTIRLCATIGDALEIESPAPMRARLPAIQLPVIVTFEKQSIPPPVTPAVLFVISLFEIRQVEREG